MWCASGDAWLVCTKEPLFPHKKWNYEFLEANKGKSIEDFEGLNNRVAMAGRLAEPWKTMVLKSLGGYVSTLNNGIKALNKTELDDYFKLYENHGAVYTELQALLNKHGSITSKELKAAFVDHQAHHIIPVNLIEKNASLRAALEWGKNNPDINFDFNSIDNLIYLHKQNHSGSHPKYDNFIETQLDLKLKDNFTPEQNFNELKKIIDKRKTDFSDGLIGDDFKINDLYD